MSDIDHITASQHSEGVRSLFVAANGAAVAQYEIAHLPDGRWAITCYCQYRCGNFAGRAIPWSAFQTRQQCVDYFVESVGNHFRREVGHDGSDQQRMARVAMLEQLGGGLFGFVEPEPESVEVGG